MNLSWNNESKAMRKLFQLISVIALATIVWFTYDALYGPNPLTGRIPTHFGIDGQPNAWGEPKMLLLLPGFAAALFLLMTIVGRFPSSFNYPVRVTPQNRERLQQIALNMVAALTAETVSLFAILQYFIIQSVRLQRNGLPPALMLISIVVIFLTIGTHILAMRRAA
jgi:uncharacterized protein DUF1648